MACKLRTGGRQLLRQFWGLGFIGFRVGGLGFIGFRAKGLGFRVQGGLCVRRSSRAAGRA